MAAAEIAQNIIDLKECTVAGDDVKPAKIAVIEPVNGLTEKIEGDEFDEWAHIGDSSFTHGFLVQSLRVNDSEFGHKHAHRPIKKVAAEDISKGKGFVSIVYKATIHFADAADRYTTIMKVPGIASLTEAFEDGCDIKLDPEMLKKISNAHQFECDFYNDVVATLQIPTPRVHLTLPWIQGKKEGVLHMEDLSLTSKTFDMFDPLSQNHIYAVCRHLAKMHKNTMMRKDWHGKYLENQNMFRDMSKMVQDCMESFYKLCENDLELKGLAEKYFKFCVNPDFISYAFAQSWKDLHIDPVIVHGDLWNGNVMWLVDEFEKPSTKVGAFVDWQIMHEGSIMADLARIITICTDGDTRRLLETELFEFYLKELTGHFEADGLTCTVTLDQVKKAYDVMFLSQAVVMPMMAVFIGKMNTECEDAGLGKARADKQLMRVKHIFEDMDRLAKGHLKWIFDKYNQ